MVGVLEPKADICLDDVRHTSACTNHSMVICYLFSIRG